MKFLRFGPPGEERPGVLDANGRIRDLSDMMSDLAGPNLARLGRVDPEALPRVEGSPRLGVPVAGWGVGWYVAVLGAELRVQMIRHQPPAVVQAQFVLGGNHAFQVRPDAPRRG